MYSKEKNKLDRKRGQSIDFPAVKIPDGKLLNGKLPGFLRGK